MPERGDLLLAEGGAGGDRAMESAVQHGTAPFVTGLQAPGTRSNLAAATGAWRYGKRSAFPTSPHPRRRRTNVERRVTLTFHLVQKICQVTTNSLITIEDAGHFFRGKERVEVGIDDFVAKVLCDTHNGALGPLDAAAGLAFLTIEALVKDIKRIADEKTALESFQI